MSASDTATTRSAQQPFSLRLLFGWITAISICIGTFMAIWTRLSEVDIFFRFCYALGGMFAVITSLLTMAAALSPWLPTPSRLRAAEHQARARDGVLALVLGSTLAGPLTLAGLVLGFLVASRWNGETGVSLYGIGFDWLFIIFTTMLGLLLGMAFSKLLALYAGSPLGRVNKYLFSALLSSSPLCLVGIFALIFPAGIGLVGLVVLLLACAASRRFDPGVTGFTVRARICSARVALCGAVIAVALWRLAVATETIRPTDFFPGVAGLCLLTLFAASLGALIGADRRSGEATTTMGAPYVRWHQ